ncbi:MAG TPA: VCBS repeat-containing protein [Clostridia bacterium]|nr:VCBS repeat-containing protein [Clostridia bacterium]
MLKKYNRIFLILLVMAVILLSIEFFSAEDGKFERINVAVLHAGSSRTWVDIYNQYSQPLLMNLTVEAIDIGQAKTVELHKYDLIYPDISVVGSQAGRQLQQDIREYVWSGGAVFLENNLYQWLPRELSGAKEFKKLAGFPAKLDAPAVRPDLTAFQKLILDFYDNYKGFKRIGELKDKSYGYGMVPDKATPIIKSGDLALYTLNRYGKGYVFFANPLLPNTWYINGFDMLPKTKSQPYFNNTVSAAGQMLRNEAATFISKQKYGYALKKVFGPYGRPAAAWQNHFEVLSAIRDRSIMKWIDTAEKHNLIPSYSLARGAYEWNRRYESIGYQYNYGSDSAMEFELEQSEAFYTPGIHPVVNGLWLTQSRYPLNQGYFSDISAPYRAYPYVADIDKDGVMDIVSGSSDGCFYYYHGRSKGKAWVLDKAQKLLSSDGKELSADRFSAPVLYDLDFDGDPDLVSGNEKGALCFFENTGNFSFKNLEPALSLGSSYSLSAPDIGDIDGDKTADLVVGTRSGHIFYFKGRQSKDRLVFAGGKLLLDDKGTKIKLSLNASPRIADLNGDGRRDLAVGTGDGYIHKLINTGSAFTDGGCFDGKDKNHLGNFHYKYGNNAVPAFADINGDGNTDLIVGRLEYGQMPVAIDSPWFPYRSELIEALEYAKDHYVNVEPHYFSHFYKSAAEEKKELELHKQAFRQYDLQWDGQGTNQHTWHINKEKPVQTLWALYRSGLRWISGFEPSGSNVEPSAASEYTWIIPFYLCKGTERSDMLVYNASIGNMKALDSYAGNWETIVSYYYHIEYNIENNPQQIEKVAEKLEGFCDKWDYAFMSEDQMAKTLMAQLNTHIEVRNTSTDPAPRKFPGPEKKAKPFEITLKPVVKMDGKGLLKGPYRRVSGVKVEFGERMKAEHVSTNADIYMWKGNSLYIGLNRDVKIYASPDPGNRLHIESANLPVRVRASEGRLRVRFLDGGLQQLRIYSSKDGIYADSKEWKLKKQEDNSFLLIRYGGPAEVTIGELE